MTYTRYYNGLDMNVQISTFLYQAEDQYCSLNYEYYKITIRAYTFLISYFLYIINIIFDCLFALYFDILIVNIMYYVYTLLYCIVYIGIVTHVKYISWTAQTDHAVTFPTSLISRYVLCCVLIISIIFFFLYIIYVCCIYQSFVFLSIFLFTYNKNLLSQKK